MRVKFAINFLKTKKVDLPKLTKKFTQFNSTALQQLRDKVESLVMGTSFLLWEAIRRKDQSKQINAAIKKSYEPKTIKKATDQVAMVLERINLANPLKPFND